MAKDKIPGEERRKQILENARILFARHGYAGARTRDIAAACGVNEAVLYKHFDCKEDLFIEVLNEMHDMVSRAARSRLKPGMSGLEIVREMINSLWFDFASKKDYFAIIIHAMTMGMDKEGYRKPMFARWSIHHERLSEAIEKGRRDGSIKSDVDSDMFASILLSLGYAYSVFNTVHISEALKTPDPIPVFETVLDCLDSQKPAHI
ncbi:MAG TPA: TetR/AcrR family transcriptional regulator [Firmicutes bacterium]|nr:TetR/AcrR family transcriptional regulator [Bacillota bacterium]